ncbi:MAG: sigma-54 interaction domain-containing protein [Myxococcales bacterium]
MRDNSSSMATCGTPFDGGPSLCRHCGLAEATFGLRTCSRLVVESEAMRAAIRRAAVIAATDASVVVLGESGSGKEVLARALHANSRRREKPFVPVNVAALPAELLESEMFGHGRGAFTGATETKRGLFEAANGGTLFLDEIGEMPLPLQAKLLRVLQDGEVRRVGETAPFSVDVRILCATHEDLRRRIGENRFREDLYYRLKVFSLTVPPLRCRVADIRPLAEMFLAGERHPTGRFTRAAQQALEQYFWPGNIRELANAVKHGAALSGGRDIDVEALPEEVVSPVKTSQQGVLRSLAEVEREHVLRVLEACGGRQGEAARILGVGRTTLWRKIRDLGLQSPS